MRKALLSSLMFFIFALLSTAKAWPLLAVTIPDLAPQIARLPEVAHSTLARVNRMFTNTVSVSETVVFEYAGNLNTARYFHTATLLDNGKVLVTGGENDGRPLGSTELFSPITRDWSPSGNLNTVREAHTATLLPDGRVIILGGRNGGGDLDGAEFYDPLTNTWLGGGDLLYHARSSHTATWLPDGTILVAGGHGSADGSYPATTEKVDPITGTRREWLSLYQGRASHTAALLPDGKVILVGGRNGGAYLGSYEIYFPTFDRWYFGQSAGSSGGEYHTTTLLTDGRLLVVGGKYGSRYSDHFLGAQLYDYKTDMWIITNRMSVGRSGHTATLLPNGKVLVIGGDSDGGYLNSVELFDPATETWRLMPSMNVPRAFHSATSLSDGKVLVVGGMTPSGKGNSTELGTYIPANVFTATLTLPSDWITNSIVSLSFVAISEGAPLAAGSLSNDGITWGDWMPVTNSLAVTTTWYCGEDGANRPVYLRLRDVQGQTATTVGGAVDVDSHAPSSSVSALHPISANPVVITWHGTDDLSGVVSYDVQAREGEAGLWADILTATTTISTTFQGVHGRTYYFRARARDAAGNLEPWPDTYDTSTLIIWLEPTPTPTNTPTPTFTPTPTTMHDTFLPLVIRDPSPTPTPTPTSTNTSTSTETPTATPTFTATPTATTPPEPAGIYGRVTYKGNSASGIQLTLWWWNGAAWSSIAQTNTGADGSYLFGSVPSLEASQVYEVVYTNNADSRYLSNWYGSQVAAYQSGARIRGGDFDIANVTLLAPSHGSSVRLPATFTWQRRGLSGDAYRWHLFDPNDSSWWRRTTDLGDVGSFSVTALPPGASYNKQYGWAVFVYSGTEGYGTSRYYHSVTFVP